MRTADVHKPRQALATIAAISIDACGIFRAAGYHVERVRVASRRISTFVEICIHAQSFFKVCLTLEGSKLATKGEACNVYMVDMQPEANRHRCLLMHLACIVTRWTCSWWEGGQELTNALASDWVVGVPRLVVPRIRRGWVEHGRSELRAGACLWVASCPAAGGDSGVAAVPIASLTGAC